MTHFTYSDNQFHAENVSLTQIAKQVGTPCYVYSRAAFETQWKSLDSAFGDHPHTVCFVAKTRKELAFAIENNVRSINIESVAELDRVQEVAASINKKASIAIRVNPDVDPETHPYISTGMDKAKFGVTMEAAYQAYKRAAQMPNIEIHGIACHIGSQITKTSPFTDALAIVINMVKRLADEGIHIQQRICTRHARQH